MRVMSNAGLGDQLHSPTERLVALRNKTGVFIPGHDVIGITLQLYDHGAATGRKGSCCAGQDIHDARRVAEALGLPHYVLDYEARFAAKVIDSFAESYVSG